MTQIPDLDDRVRDLERRWRARDATAGLMTACAAGVAAFLIGFHVDRLVPHATAGRTAWLLAIVGTLLLGGAAACIGASLRPLPGQVLAAAVERRYPHLSELLMSAVELAPAGAGAGMSGELVAVVAREATRRSAGLNFASALPVRRWRRALALLATALATLGLHALVAPGAVSVWLQRVMWPGADIPPFAATRVFVTPGDVVVPRGAVVRIGVVQEGVRRSRARLWLAQGSGPWRSMDVRPSPGGEMIASVGPLDADLRYWAAAGDGRSNPHRVRVEDPPALVEVRMHLKYPDYLGRRKETLRASALSLAAPVGTRVRFEVLASKPLASARLSLAGIGESRWDAVSGRASGELRLTRDVSGSLHLRDRNGFEANPPPEVMLRAIPDRAPSVAIERPGADIERTPFGSVDLRVSASDDHGVSRLALSYGSARSSGLLSLPAVFADGRRRAAAVTRWNLARLGLRSGDALTYRAEAHDGDTVTGPHVGRSAEYRVRIVGAREMRERLDAESAEERAALLRLAERQSAVARAVRTAGGARAARAEQAAIAGETAALSRRMEATTAGLRVNNLAGESELARRDGVQARLGALARREMPEAMRLVDRGAYAQAAGAQRAIAAEMRRLAARSGPTPTPAELAEEASRLAREQSRLANQSEVAADSQGAGGSVARRDLAERQAALGERTDALRERMRAALVEAREQGDRSAADREARSLASMDRAGLPALQERARQSLATGRPGEASGPQRSAADALREAASALDEPAQAAVADPVRRARELSELADRLQDMANDERAVIQAANRNPTGEQRQSVGARQDDIARRAASAAASLADTPDALFPLQQAQRDMAEVRRLLAGNQAAATAAAPARSALVQLLRAAQAAEEASNALRERQWVEGMRRTASELAAEQRRVERATEQLAQTGAQMPERDRAAREHEVGRAQEQVHYRAQELGRGTGSRAARLAFAEAARHAGRAMVRLRGRDVGPVTRAEQRRAAEMLERIAAAYGRQEQTAQQQRASGGQQGAMSQRMAELSAEIDLAREVEHSLLRSTAALDADRARRSDPTASDDVTNRARELASLQEENRSVTETLAEPLRGAPGVGERVADAAARMRAAREALERRQTGRPAQSQQEAAIAGLDEAAETIRRSLAERRQQMSQAGSGQEGARRQEGQEPARGTTAPVVEAQPGAFAMVRPGGAGFGSLPPRALRALQEGRGERVPAEYRELVKRYYRALAERGR